MIRPSGVNPNKSFFSVKAPNGLKYVYTDLSQGTSVNLDTVAGSVYSAHVAGNFDGATGAIQFVVNGSTGVYADSTFSGAGGVQFIACGNDLFAIESGTTGVSLNLQLSFRS